MASTPQRNATLLAIHASEGADTWTAETAGPAKWQPPNGVGAGIYARSNQRRRRSGNSTAIDLEWTLILSQGVPPIVVGDIVTFHLDRPGSQAIVAPVAAASAPSAPRGAAMPNFLKTQTVTLEPVGDTASVADPAE